MLMKYPEQWNKEGKFLVRVFVFKNFVEAVDFVNNLVPIAEEMKHHPDIEIFSYKKVKLKLTTHEAGGITEKDIEFALKINKMFL